MKKTNSIRVAVAGLGAIGGNIVKQIGNTGSLPGLTVTAVAARDHAKAKLFLAEVSSDIPVIPLPDLSRHADIVVECLPSDLFDEVAYPTVDAGRTLIVMSAGCLLDRPDLVERARRTGARIIVPSGAILGLDAIKATAEGVLHAVTIRTKKPPKGLSGASYLVDRGINVDGLTEPLCIFSGSVREAARHFPANVNVAAAISLAGLGPDRTAMEVWADPALQRNTHQVEVKSDSSNFTLAIQNTPSDENPRTGRITPQSVLACLRQMTAPLRVGT